MTAIYVVAPDAPRAEVRDTVFTRDRFCILTPDWHHQGEPTGLLHQCGGDRHTPHHLQKASQGGPYTLQNLVTLCARHNTWVEDNPRQAHAWGLVVRHGDTIGRAWTRMQFAGLVDYWWDGSPEFMPWPE